MAFQSTFLQRKQNQSLAFSAPSPCSMRFKDGSPASYFCFQSSILAQAPGGVREGTDPWGAGEGEHMSGT